MIQINEPELFPDPRFYRPPRVGMGKERGKIYRARYDKMTNHNAGMTLQPVLVLWHQVYLVDV